jgi:hypothetical protein
MNCRRPLPMLAMSVTPPEGGTPPVPTPPAVPQGYVSQETVNALMARQAQEGAAKIVKQQLGVDDLATAKQMIADAKKIQEAQMTADQQATAAKAAAEQAKAEADTAKAEAAAERLLLRTEQALIRAGVPVDVVDAAGTATPNPQLPYLLRAVQVEPGADAPAIAAAVAKVKTDLPQLFATPAAPPAGTPPPVIPPRGAANGGQSEAPGASGRRALTEYGFVRPPAAT